MLSYFPGYIADLGGECIGEENESGPSYKNIIGVVGASSSVTSIQVANLLKLFKIPQVNTFFPLL